MVHLLTSLIFFTTIVAGFANPLVKRDCPDIVARMGDITSQFCAFEQSVGQFGNSHSSQDFAEMNSIALSIGSAFQDATSAALQAGVFPDDCSDQAVDALFALEPHVLNSIYCLIELKPDLSALGVLHKVAAFVDEMHGHSTKFANTVRDDNLPADFHRRWQSIQAPIGKVLEQAQVYFSAE